MKEGWKKEIISNCFKLKSGEYLSSKMMKSGKYPVYGGNGITGMHDDFNLSGNNIIIGRVGALCGNTRYINSPIWATDNAFVITDYKYKFDHIFLTYQLNFINLRQYARQAAQPVISNSSLKDVSIIIPPLSEQQRIVNILDEAFAKLDTVKQNAERNLNNAKELFQSVLEYEITSNMNWRKAFLKDICSDIFAGGDAPNEYSEHKTKKYNIPIFANAVKNRGLYGYTNLARVREPSITIAARGSGTGHIELRQEPFLPIVRLIVLIPNIELITLEFLKYSISNLTIMRSGSAIPQLTVPMIKGYIINFPSLSEQQQIVSKLDALSERCKELENNYQQTINSCDELKKAILVKVFNGEL